MGMELFIHSNIFFVGLFGMDIRGLLYSGDTVAFQ